MNKFNEPWLYLIQSLTAKCFATSRCHPPKMIFEWGAKTTRPGGVANRTPSQPPSYRSRSLPPARETLGTRWTLSSEDMRRGAFIKKARKVRNGKKNGPPGLVIVSLSSTPDLSPLDPHARHYFTLLICPREQKRGLCMRRREVIERNRTTKFEWVVTETDRMELDWFRKLYSIELNPACLIIFLGPLAQCL